jgi:hypothetical protein
MKANLQRRPKTFAEATRRERRQGGQSLNLNKRGGGESDSRLTAASTPSIYRRWNTTVKISSPTVKSLNSMVKNRGLFGNSRGSFGNQCCGTRFLFPRFSIHRFRWLMFAETQMPRHRGASVGGIRNRAFRTLNCEIVSVNQLWFERLNRETPGAI